MSKKKYHRGRRKKSVKLNREALNKTASGRLSPVRAATNQTASGKTLLGRMSLGNFMPGSFTLNGIKPDRRRMKLVGAGVLFLFVILFVQMASASGKDTSAQITLAVNDTEILQDEAVPAMTVTARCPEGQQELLLDESSGYKVKDLVQRLNMGDGVSLTCETDGKEEGSFPIKLEFTGDLADSIKTKWADIVYLTISDGTLKVKNKIGEWKKDKFQRYDGSYVENDFVNYKGEQYYFGEDGKKVTGWQDINGQRYHFTKKGIMEKDTWKKKDGGKCYLNPNGTMATGWMELDGELYCFDEDGLMMTGKKQVGSSACEFDDDGRLVARESKIDPEKPMMALTFDDGPGERTGELLDVLEKYNAHATFFMQGKNVEQYAKEIKRMKELECEIGNHSFDHPQLTLESDGGAGQIGKTNELLKEACGQSATVMRPPYGACDERVGASVGMPMILWNIDTLDWKTMNAQMTIDNVLTNADDGDIVLMHDIHSPSIDAAIELIPRLINNGYQLVTVTEMAQARGIVLKNGESYTDFNK